ncbi:hypothetical protein [Exercitatus varius]|uniref:hypothetical protein n=1 Tax=Exercitatus varius TaxID=67857 RepID=UPI00294AAAAA|nr:hypothetical protein [Exercitatus varius]MDG2942884.1 hypothetical protein [Exercitatus varius]MDG2962957.1 hypothetical protein [Exercitatus varius]
MKQSLGYANDRSVYNALNQSKLTSKKIQELFLRKGILCSSDTDRDALSSYFSRLTHDFFDHKFIANSIGVIPRREKITSTEIIAKDNNSLSHSDIKTILKDVEAKLNFEGCIVKYKTSNNEQELEITYTEIDYSRTDFQQMITRTGKISVDSEKEVIHIRSTQAKFINEVKENLVLQLISLDKNNLKKNVINLSTFDIPDMRTQFFLETIRNIDEYELEEISQVGLYKNKNLFGGDVDIEENEEATIGNINDAHLKGNAVHLTPELKLLSEKGFYYVKVISTLKGKKDNLLYTVDIEFKDKENCEEFSYIVKHINEPKYDPETKSLTSYKSPRAPKPSEQINFIDKLEKSAKNSFVKINQSINPYSL